MVAVRFNDTTGGTEAAKEAGDMVDPSLGLIIFILGRPMLARDATPSSGSNLGQTNQTFIARVNTGVQKDRVENPCGPVPVDLVTASGSGLVLGEPRVNVLELNLDLDSVHPL